MVRYLPAGRQGAVDLLNCMDESYSVYAIISGKDRRIYVGMSSDITRRLKEHNGCMVRSTKSYVPWSMFYSEFVGDRRDARIREKYLKSGCGKEYLKQKYSNTVTQ